MFINNAYYSFKFLVPRFLQIWMRRSLVRKKLLSCADIWPIDQRAGEPPKGWTGWPDGKKFALVLTHDVETAKGADKCSELSEIEENLGFRSSFNFVAEDYTVRTVLRQHLKKRGFEIGVHGLHHDNNPFRSKAIFQKQAIQINRYLKKWGSVGFRCPSMYHNLELLHHLEIEYDASTFDTDPFEPQPDGVGTIFPFWVAGNDRQNGYVELPYTLAQDFLLFILLQKNDLDIWKKKLDWIADHGGMALMNVHPDYMDFDGKRHYEQYPATYYEEFLNHIKSKYDGQYWHALPQEVARFCAGKNRVSTLAPLPPAPLASPQPIRVCMLVYSFYESDNRVMRYAEALVKRGNFVDVIALRKEGMPRYENIRGVDVYRIQRRIKDEKGQLSFLVRLIKFFIASSFVLAKRHIKNHYNLIHVHNVPDFLVYAAILPKMTGSKIILDIHDVVPELYASLFKNTENRLIFKSLVAVEKASCRFSDHVIVANDIWHKVMTARSVSANKSSVILNYPDNNVFFKRPRTRRDNKFVMVYPGSLNRRQGVDISIKAFALIKDKIPMAELHIYGEGADKDYLERLVIDLELQKQVFINASLPIYEVADKMSNADLGIEPKRNDIFAGDAMSTKILEFMSLGIPVIASDTRVHKYYFDESVVLFFKSDDEQDMARCMLSIIEDVNLYQKMRQNIDRFVEDYTWDKKINKYYKLVDELTHRGSEKP